MRTVLFVAALTVTTLPATPLLAQLTTVDPRFPMVVVTGRGEVKRPPDAVELTVGLLSRSSTPAGAANDLDRLLMVVRDSLRAHRIVDSMIVLGVRTIDPAQNYPEHEITGYSAGLSVAVTLREIPRLAELLDALAGAGATELSQIVYKSDHEEADHREAAAKAVADARLQADALARAAGGRLGSLVSMQTYGAGYYGRYTGHFDAGEVPEVQAQEAVQVATVTIYWRFEGR